MTEVEFLVIPLGDGPALEMPVNIGVSTKKQIKRGYKSYVKLELI
jgi:hypothetical protein